MLDGMYASIGDWLAPWILPSALLAAVADTPSPYNWIGHPVGRSGFVLNSNEVLAPAS